MTSFFVKCCVTLAAIALIILRFIRPDIQFDSTLIVLIVIGVVPWMASVLELKGFELPGGFKFEFKEGSAKERHVSTPVVSAPVASPTQLSKAPLGTALADTYLARLVKFTPIETIIAYLVTDRMIPIDSAHRLDLRWVAAALFLVATPVYLRLLGARASQLLVPTVGFAVWVVALGGPLEEYAWYQPMYGALALMLFTYGAPFFPPDEA